MTNDKYKPVFLVNSRLGLFSAATSGVNPNVAPLLPKLRGHFAEFLNNSSLAGLRILSSPTCKEGFQLRASISPGQDNHFQPSDTLFKNHQGLQRTP